MDLEIIILSEVKSDNKRQISYDTTYMWYLKYDTNDLICKIETRHTENELVVSKGKSDGESIN